MSDTEPGEVVTDDTFLIVTGAHYGEGFVQGFGNTVALNITGHAVMDGTDAGEMELLLAFPEDSGEGDHPYAGFLALAEFMAEAANFVKETYE